MCSTSDTTLVGHDGPLAALAWSNDGAHIASGGADRVIRIWDAESGRCHRSLVGHTGGVFDVAFSPDGTVLVSAGADGTVRVWDVDSGTERHVLRGHILPVYAVAFHPDGRRFASAGGDTVVKLWDAARGTELLTLQGHDTPVGRLQFDADGSRLASCGVIRGTLIWDLESRAVVHRLTQPGDYRFTPDFATGFFAFPTGEFGAHDVVEKAIDKAGIGVRGIHSLDADGTGRIVAVAAADDTIRVVDRETATTLVTHRGHIGPARRVVLRADARRLASAGADGTVRVWAVPDPNEPVPFSGFHEHNVTAVAFTRDGSRLAAGDYIGCIAVWDPATGKRVVKLGSHYLRRKSQTVALELGTGKPIVQGKTPLKNYTHYSAGTSARDPIVECFTSEGHGGEVKGVAFTPDGRTLVSAGAEKLIVWNLADGSLVREVEHPALVSSLAVSPDGTLAATGCWDGLVRVFRIPTGELVAALEGHTHNVMSVAFHPGGRHLASGSRDHTVIVWDVERRGVKHRLRRHGNTVAVVRYTPDGKRLVTGGLDKVIHVWDAETGRYESSLHSHSEGVTSLEFSSDGRWLVSASDGAADTDSHVWLWNFDRYREGALVGYGGNKGPTALAVNPATGDLVLGRHQLKTIETKPVYEPPPRTAEPIPTTGADDGRLGVLGYALVDEIAAWPDGSKNRLSPESSDGKFLVVAASLPFDRVKTTGADFERLLDAHRKDSDGPLPLKLSSLLISPRRFTLLPGNGPGVSAAFVGRVALAEREGFEFMPKNEALLENMTNTPQPNDREVVYLAWEVGDDFSADALRLRFDGDVPVPVPSLVLEKFRPGKPFHTASRGFHTAEGGTRLRSNVTRAPVP
jgi:WD40 repeat protein